MIFDTSSLLSGASSESKDKESKPSVFCFFTSASVCATTFSGIGPIKTRPNVLSPLACGVGAPNRVRGDAEAILVVDAIEDAQMELRVGLTSRHATPYSPKWPAMTPGGEAVAWCKVTLGTPVN